MGTNSCLVMVDAAVSMGMKHCQLREQLGAQEDAAVGRAGEHGRADPCDEERGAQAAGTPEEAFQLAAGHTHADGGVGPGRRTGSHGDDDGGGG